MDKEEIISYVMHSPENTNPNVLRGILNTSGGGSSDFFVISLFYDETIEDFNIDKNYQEILNVLNTNALILLQDDNNYISATAELDDDGILISAITCIPDSPTVILGKYYQIFVDQFNTYVNIYDQPFSLEFSTANLFVNNMLDGAYINASFCIDNANEEAMSTGQTITEVQPPLGQSTYKIVLYKGKAILYTYDLGNVSGNGRSIGNGQVEITGDCSRILSRQV